MPKELSEAVGLVLLLVWYATPEKRGCWVNVVCLFVYYTFGQSIHGQNHRI